LNLINDPMRMMYEYYLEVNRKSNIATYGHFVQTVQLKCLETKQPLQDLIAYICRLLEGNLKVWRVYDKDKNFVCFC